MATPTPTNGIVDQFIKALRGRMPHGMSIDASIDHAKNELKLRTMFAGGVHRQPPTELIEIYNVVDLHILHSMHDPSGMAEQYSTMISSRMTAEINAKTLPEGEVRALLNIASCTCRYDMATGHFEVGALSANNRDKGPSFNVDEEADITEWRRAISDFVEVNRLRAEHPRFKIEMTERFDHRAQKRRDSVRRDQQQKMMEVAAQSPNMFNQNALEEIRRCMESDPGMFEPSAYEQLRQRMEIIRHGLEILP